MLLNSSQRQLCAKGSQPGRGLALFKRKTNSQTSIRRCRGCWASNTDQPLLDVPRTEEDAEGIHSYWGVSHTRVSGTGTPHAHLGYHLKRFFPGTRRYQGPGAG